jgi:hypothetical protein
LSSNLFAVRHNDTKLETDAHEIRFRAERKLGEMMREQPKAPAGRPPKKIGVSETPISAKPITLLQAGIDKNLAKAGHGGPRGYSQKAVVSRYRNSGSS